jgi:tetratricopeptide (TPR) repeat protein
MGYPGIGRLLLREGQVTALYRFDGGSVIQNSASFFLGESGGGLFDKDGRLVGILTFKSPAGGPYHFAVPVEWLAAASSAVPSKSTDPGQKRAFWERDAEAPQSLFLRAAAFEARQQWGPLLDHARRWSEIEAQNPESWVALGKAYNQLNRAREAEALLRKAVEMAPLHAEAWYQLGLTYRDLNEKDALERVRRTLDGMSPALAAELSGSSEESCTTDC